MKGIDLHVHSLCSDGTYTPSELVKYALEKQLKAFALTDHDTVDGVQEAFDAAMGTGLTVVPGVELSTEYEGKDIHILGLYIQIDSQPFLEHLDTFKNSRIHRNEKMCQKLQDAGIPITVEALKELCPNATITRSHYAAFLLEHGFVSSRKEAFERYIGENCPYFVPREKVSPFQAIHLIKAAGGIPILAHPPLYHMGKERLELLVKTLTERGLMGLEAIYSTYTAAQTKEMKELAKKYNLAISGGSDFHGANKPGLDLKTGYGSLFVPESILEQLQSLLS
jgi:predicted metal-dependent phosphoesterase TrpH